MRAVVKTLEVFVVGEFDHNAPVVAQDGAADGEVAAGRQGDSGGVPSFSKVVEVLFVVDDLPADQSVGFGDD